LRTVYNARHKFKVVESAGRSQMQQLLEKLFDHSYIEIHRCCPHTDTVKDILWAHPATVDLLHAFPRVLIMDCTYMTNRYRLPSMEIIGVISTEMTFSIAFAYLKTEREDKFSWCLDRLRFVACWTDTWCILELLPPSTGNIWSLFPLGI